MPGAIKSFEGRARTPRPTSFAGFFSLGAIREANDVRFPAGEDEKSLRSCGRAAGALAPDAERDILERFF